MTKKIILLLALILLSASCEAAENDGFINFDPLATTYSENDPASLTLIRMKENGEIYFVASDASANTMAFVKYSSELYNFYLNKGENGYPPLIFLLILPMQERGQLDDNLGAWQNTLHLVPTYALFNVEGGQIICEKPFFSADSLESTHYHDRIQNPKNERLVEIFMTHMPRLHDEVNARGISLP